MPLERLDSPFKFPLKCQPKGGLLHFETRPLSGGRLRASPVPAPTPSAAVVSEADVKAASASAGFGFWSFG